MDPMEYKDEALREFGRLKKLADDAVAQLDDSQFLASPAADSNSVAIIVKHLAGNMRSRWRDFLTTDGEKSDRHRDTEFELSADESRHSVMARWEQGWDLVFGAVAPLTAEDFTRSVAIRGEAHTVLQAVNRQVAHYAYHVGQIVFAAKQIRGAAWNNLSVAKGQSRQFKAAPERFIVPPKD